MYIRFEMKNENCDAIERYCRSLYGPRRYNSNDEYMLRQDMAREHCAEYFLDREIGCDVLVFKEEADYIFFKLKSNIHLTKET
jgi:hypothetical protein